MSEVVEPELRNMYERAREDLKKATGLLKPKEENQKSAADRYIKLSKRFYDIYKLFLDTFQTSLNVIAAKSMLLFARACFAVSHKVSSTNWLSVPRNPTPLRQAVSLPKRAVHKMLKRTMKSALYLFNHDDGEYEKLGFVKLEKLSGKKRDYNKELCGVGAGLKELGTRLLLLFNATDLVNEEEVGEGMKEPIDVEKFSSFYSAADDLSKSHEIVLAYYKAIFALNEKRRDQSEPADGRQQIVDCLSPLMTEFGMTLRSNVVSGIDEEKRNRTVFMDITDSLADVGTVTKLLYLLDTTGDI